MLISSLFIRLGSVPTMGEQHVFCYVVHTESRRASKIERGKFGFEKGIEKDEIIFADVCAHVVYTELAQTAYVRYRQTKQREHFYFPTNSRLSHDDDDDVDDEVREVLELRLSSWLEQGLRS
jgi:hypothetical protein